MSAAKKEQVVCPHCKKKEKLEEIKGIYFCTSCNSYFYSGEEKLFVFDVKKLSLLIGIVVAISIIIPSVALISSEYYFGKPAFCRGCHIMEPYFDSWEQSSHKGIDCYLCHYGPGLAGLFKGGISEMPFVYETFIGVEKDDMTIRAEITNENCYQCHENILIESTKEYEGTLFNHVPHMEEIRRGLELQCVSCHSQIHIGDQFVATESTCFICHFEGTEDDPISGCPSCHDFPHEDIEYRKISFSHQIHVDNAITCTFCHTNLYEITEIEGKEGCKTCHDEREKDIFEKDWSNMHEIHMTEHEITCEYCHDTVTHEPLTDADNCSNCHLAES